MRRAIFDRLGPPAEVIRLIAEPDPVPGPGEALVRLTVMPINPADLLRIEGRYGAGPEPLPATPGAEAYGVVAALGPGTEGLSPGQGVIPLGGGRWADRLVAPARALAPVPEGVDPEQAAMLLANPATAEAMLGLAPLEPGDWVIQNAANSAVGRLVIRFAKAKGLHTLNIVRREGLTESLRADGADLVARAGAPLPALPATPKLALDAVGGAETGALARALAPGGLLVSYGLLSGAPAQVDLRDLVFRGITHRGFWLAEWFRGVSGREARALYAGLFARLQAGAFHTAVEARYDLAQAAEAVAHAARPGRSGKILLTSET